MSVRIDGSTKYLRRTTGLIDFQSPYTVAFWYNPASNTGSGYQAILTISSGGSAYDEFFLDSGGAFSLECSGNSATTVDGRVPIIDRWYHIALVRRSQTLMEVYVDGVLDITNTANVSARNPATAANLSFGTNAFSEWSDGRFTNAKAWQIALSRAEIITERTEFAPVRQANTHAWWPMLPGARSVDWSGNARSLTEGGALTDEAGPLPVAHPLWWLPVATASGGTTLDGSVTLATILAASNGGLLAAAAGITLASGMGYGEGGQWAGGGGVSLPYSLAITDGGLIAAGGAINLPAGLGLSDTSVLAAIAALALAGAMSFGDTAALTAGNTVSLATLLVAQDSAALAAEAQLALTAQLAQLQAATAQVGGSVNLPAGLTVTLAGALGPTTYDATLTLTQLQSVAAAGAWLANAGLQLSVQYSIQPTAGGVVDGSLALQSVFALADAGSLSGSAVIQLAFAVAQSLNSQLSAQGGTQLSVGLGTATQSLAESTVHAVLAAAIGLTTAGGMSLINSLALQLAAGIVAGSAIFSGSTVTPDGRIVQVVVEARVVTIGNDVRVLVIPIENRSVTA